MTQSWSRVALGALVVGLAVHNLVMAELWDAGLRGTALDVVAAWKEAVLAVALATALWSSRRLPLALAADRLAVVYAAFVVLYAVLPQSWLDGGATTRGVLYAVRHDLVPVAAYAFGRLAALSARDRRALAGLAGTVGVALSLWGLVDVYAVPLQWWRDSGVPGWFEHQLALDYGPGLSHLPENWVYNTGDEQHPLRRLVSTFLTPLATSYLLVVALVFLASRRRPGRWQLFAAVACFAGLLWTHTRAATLALTLGLVLLGAAQRRWLPVVAGAAALAISIGFFAAYTSIGPETSYTKSELAYLRENAEREGPASGNAFSAGESSISSHWRNLKEGIRTVVHHPQGFGLGNAGTEAKRTDVTIKAGESTYTELGVEIGIAGLLAFCGWCAALLAGLWRISAWLFAALAATLALALQTDVLGVHWLVYVLFALAGSALAEPRREGPEPTSWL